MTNSSNPKHPTEPQIEHGVPTPVPDTPVTLRYQWVDELSEHDFEGLLALFERAFNGGPSWFHHPLGPEAYLRWKASGARGIPSRIEITENEQGIVGFRMTMWRRFLVQGQPIVGTEGVDATIDPSLQGQRITSKRAEFSSDNGMRGPSCFGMGYAMHPTSRVRRGVSDDDTIVAGERLEALVRPLSVRGLVARLRDGAPRSRGTSRTRSAMESRMSRWYSRLSPSRLALAARIVWSLVRPKGRAPRGPWQIRTITAFDERADRLFEQAAPQFDLIQVRDISYVNWRFCDPRSGGFIVRVAEHDGELLGYAATRVERTGAVLADMLTLPDRPDVAAALIRDAIDLAKGLGAPAIRTYMPEHHPYRPLLGRAGFVRNPLPITLAFAPEDCDASSLAFLAEPSLRVHVMTADTDHV